MSDIASIPTYSDDYINEPNDPKTFIGSAVQGGKAKGKAKGKGIEAPPPEDGEEKEKLLIREVWTQGTDSIHGRRDVNTDAVSYQSKTSEK